jgi:hypothetical protein
LAGEALAVYVFVTLVVFAILMFSLLGGRR